MNKSVLMAFKFILLFSVFSWAAHREHQAHSHGGGILNIAFDGLSGKIELRGAAEGFLGFEHPARSNKDKKHWRRPLRTSKMILGK